LETDKLYDGFRSPPAQARPFVRWTWSADRPTEDQIIRRLDLFKQAGFGGIEICPAPGMLDKDGNNRLRFTADAASNCQMLVDLTLPVAGLPLPLTEQSQIVTLSKKMLTGPATHIEHIDDLIKIPDEARPITSSKKHRLLFLRLIPRDRTTFTSGIKLRDKVGPDGSVEFEVPDGNYTLYAGFQHVGFTQTGKDAAGPVLDHLNVQAVDKYFNNISTKLAPMLGDQIGGPIHALVYPGVELSGANWTTDFPVEFAQRRGYDIIPYLPVLFDNGIPIEGTRFYEIVRRSRYDFYTTLAELFHERFIATFNNFCHDNGLLCRLRAAGDSQFIDILNGAMLPDIPQGRIAVVSGEQFSDPNRLYCIENKIASSAAHLTGKSIVDCELMAGSAVESSQFPRDLDAADNLCFASGANHSVLNIYGSTSLHDSARLDTFFDESNSLLLKKWTERNARLSYLFQNSKYRATIAILCPTSEIWSDFGLSKDQFVNYIWYMFPLWQALGSIGYTTDYVSEKVIQKATFEDGRLHFGSQAYDALIIPETFSVELTTARALRSFVRAGGKVAFIGQSPLNAPGLKEVLERSVGVDVTIDYLRRKHPARVIFLRPPDMESDNIISLVSELTERFALTPTVKIAPPADKLRFVHYLADSRNIFFFTNTDPAASVSFTAQFDITSSTAWQWDPVSANRKRFPSGGDKSRLDIKLKPLDSLLLVFEPDKRSTSPAMKIPDVVRPLQ